MQSIAVAVSHLKPYLTVPLKSAHLMLLAKKLTVPGSMLDSTDGRAKLDPTWITGAVALAFELEETLPFRSSCAAPISVIVAGYRDKPEAKRAKKQGS